MKQSVRITTAGVAGTILMLVAVAICARLGFWQLDRLQQRTANNAAISARLDMPAISIADVPDDTAGLLYRRVRLVASFDTAYAFALAGRSRRGAPGVYVFAPARTGAGTAVLVNRGWLPSADGATVNLDSVARGDARLTGIVLPIPPADDRPEGEPGFRRVLFRLNDSLRPRFPYPLLPAYVQALPEPGAEVLPRRLALPDLDSGPHMSYAFQWFSFAAIALVGWTLMVARTRYPKNERGAEAPPSPSSEDSSAQNTE